MSKILSNINDFSTKYSGLLSLLQILTPAILIACFYVFTLYMNANFVNRPEYEEDKEKSEKALEVIVEKLGQIINSQTSFSTQITNIQYGFQDLNERIKFVERKESIRGH